MAKNANEPCYGSAEMSSAALQSTRNSINDNTNADNFPMVYVGLIQEDTNSIFYSLRTETRGKEKRFYLILLKLSQFSQNTFFVFFEDVAKSTSSC